MANICVMPEDVAESFVTQYGWKFKRLKKPVHMGAVSHDGIVVLQNIVVNTHNKFQQPFYIAPRGTMTICTTDYISRLGLEFTILAHQGGFVIREPRGKILYQGKVAPDKFHYIEWDAFNSLRPVKSLESHIEAKDMEDFISDVCCELDIINRDSGHSSVAVNATAKDNHIRAEIVRFIRDAHVRYAHQK
jgi:hypothetical protein